ncbi:DNA gyrase inhibitor YacG [Sabulicella glaciei]|uniref:DNA gyrase inhibitor YacG n=1 Tax=Sabulicella glaciei TaxID=2984948 RepID=A0ABT3NSZ2_9PROT|nr:DNA gyrase inhibitor YacG [Roseococcus sp. MDT2-1-1]MCW8085277.1 DNA gyrase inhibitor YacG [Roseococcus sp. MDT2-1-1]
MPDPRCPVCGQPSARRSPGERSAFPFCSDRCRQVDLARWFGERYAVPAEEEDAPGDDDATVTGQG